MIDFYRTAGGKRFIDHTIPDLALQLQRVANALNRLLDVIERKPSLDPRKKEGG